MMTTRDRLRGSNTYARVVFVTMRLNGSDGEDDGEHVWLGYASGTCLAS
jgi:hypothetical protein